MNGLLSGQNSMEKLNFVRDGESKLPPGFRFQPTDQEIVFQYLARKVFSYPLPASIIPEINIFSFHPWEFPGDSEQDRYFFSNNMTNYRNMSVLIDGGSRTGCGGYWKPSSGTDHKPIICSKNSPIIGIRKTLVFYKGNHPNAARTDWTMNLYCIAISRNNLANNSNIPHQRQNSQGSLVQIGNWSLCHVFQEKSSNLMHEEVIYDNSSLTNYDSIDHVDMSDADSFSVSSSSSSPDYDPSEVSSSIKAKW